MVHLPHYARRCAILGRLRESASTQKQIAEGLTSANGLWHSLSRLVRGRLIERAVDGYRITRRGRAWLAAWLRGLLKCVKCGRYRRKRGKGYCRECSCRVKRAWGKTVKGRASMNRSNRKRHVSGNEWHTKGKSAARRRGHAWNLGIEEHRALLSEPCYSCQLPVPMMRAGVGLDRIDNSKGYVSGNVVPCCGLCNRIRGDAFTFREMRLVLGPAIRRILDARGVKMAVNGLRP